MRADSFDAVEVHHAAVMARLARGDATPIPFDTFRVRLRALLEATP